MVKEIVRDTLFLSKKSDAADKSDLQTAEDLLDTLKAHSEECVGMAANMIGVSKRIIAVNDGKSLLLMINPTITDHTNSFYETEEGCLSLTGERTAKRFNAITAEYLDRRFKKQKKVFKGDTAQIIQHECDHLEGIII